MSKRRPLITALLAAVTAVAAAMALGILASRVSTVRDLWVTVSDDTYAVLADGGSPTGAEPRLVAGAGGGLAAITFLKFRVPALPAGVPVRRADLRLTRARGPFPDHVELVRVPSNQWAEGRLRGWTAPRLGGVVGTARPDPLDGSVVFDVSRVIRAAGTYSFAVTAPPGDGLAQFVAKEARRGYAQPAIWLSAAGRPIPRELTSEPPTDPVEPPSTAKPSGEPPSTAEPSGEPPSTGEPPAEPPSTGGPSAEPPSTAEPSPTGGPPSTGEPSPTPEPPSTGEPSAEPSPTVEPSVSPTEPPEPPDPPDPGCTVGDRLVPTCGVLWGVAPGAHSDTPRPVALRRFEEKTARPQAIYHTYHRGTTEIFPTANEIEVAREPGNPRILFLNWKPTGASWAGIARGDVRVDSYLDGLARHIRENVPEPFFFTVHHEPENDVRVESGSGWTPRDYAAMFRHVVQRLRGAGVTNLVSVVAYMAYVPWNAKPWFGDLYPGNDVVDWVAWDAYAYSDPGYGHGDFAEMMNRRSHSQPGWPGFYNWAAARFPDKPMMLAEWGVWHSARNQGHKPYFYWTVGRQIQLFPRVKALVYFDTPHNQKGMDSRVDSTEAALDAYRWLGCQPVFQVDISDAGPPSPPTPGTRGP